MDTPPWAGGTALPMNASDGSFNSPTERVEATVATGCLAAGQAHPLRARARRQRLSGLPELGPHRCCFPLRLTGRHAHLYVHQHSRRFQRQRLPDRLRPRRAPPYVATPTSTGVPSSTEYTRVRLAHADRSCYPVHNHLHGRAPHRLLLRAVQELTCRGAISGYSDNTFRPYNNTTRGQLTKIVVLAEACHIDTTGGPHFTDVPTTNPFFAFIETAYNRWPHLRLLRRHIQVGQQHHQRPTLQGNRASPGVVSGYNRRSALQRCAHHQPFYSFIETAYNHGIIIRLLGRYVPPRKQRHPRADQRDSIPRHLSALIRLCRLF